MNDYKTSSFMQMLKVTPPTTQYKSVAKSSQTSSRKAISFASQITPRIVRLRKPCLSFNRKRNRASKCCGTKVLMGIVRCEGVCPSLAGVRTAVSRSLIETAKGKVLDQEDSDGSGWQTLCRGQWVAQLYSCYPSIASTWFEQRFRTYRLYTLSSRPFNDRSIFCSNNFFSKQIEPKTSQAKRSLTTGFLGSGLSNGFCKTKA